MRPQIARRREQWKKYRDRPDPRRLVFIDGTWAKTNMTPMPGLAICPGIGEPVALHAAKRRGKNRSKLFRPGMAKAA